MQAGLLSQLAAGSGMLSYYVAKVSVRVGMSMSVRNREVFELRFSLSLYLFLSGLRSLRPLFVSTSIFPFSELSCFLNLVFEGISSPGTYTSRIPYALSPISFFPLCMMPRTSLNRVRLPKS